MLRHTHTLRHRLWIRQEETTGHVLVHCQKYDAVKKTMIQNLLLYIYNNSLLEFLFIS